MNQALAKVEAPVVGDSEEIRTADLPAVDPAESRELFDEPAFDESTQRRLYRRSVAYFVFGFGCNRHSIVTDEPVA